MHTAALAQLASRWAHLSRCVPCSRPGATTREEKGVSGMGLR